MYAAMISTEEHSKDDVEKTFWDTICGFFAWWFCLLFDAFFLLFKTVIIFVPLVMILSMVASLENRIATFGFVNQDLS